MPFTQTHLALTFPFHSLSELYNPCQRRVSGAPHTSLLVWIEEDFSNLQDPAGQVCGVFQESFWSNHKAPFGGPMPVLGQLLCSVIVRDQAFDVRQFLVEVLAALLLFPITRKLFLVLFVLLQYLVLHELVLLCSRGQRVDL